MQGMEWDCVELTDDFQRYVHNGELITEVLDTPWGKRKALMEEVNILYVAITRAKKQLIMNYTVIELLQLCCAVYL